MSFRVIFFGTPKIAAACLQALLDEKINVVGVVTKPDRPIGRKQIIEKNEVKLLAEKARLTIFQPEKINEIYDKLLKLQPDLIVVCAYGKIISERVLNIPKFHCVNVHTSLLPRWRGGAPIHHAVLNRDKVSGVTLMYMTKELDAGNIIYQERLSLDKRETYRSLYDKLTDVSYNILRKRIHHLFSDQVASKTQNNTLVTIAKNISREDEKVNWNQSAKDVDAKIRGLYDEPIAYSTYKGMIVKIYEADVNDELVKRKPGEIITIDPTGITVACGNGSIKITKLQMSGKKPIFVKEMLNGNHVFNLKTSFDY